MPDTGPEAIDTAAQLAKRHWWMDASDDELNARYAATESREDIQAKAKSEAAWRAIVGDWGTRYAASDLDEYIVDGKEQVEVLSKVKGYANRLAENIKAGRSITLFGPYGTGKDFLVSALMRLAVLECGLSGKWVNGQDFYGRVRDSMDGGERESKLVKELVTPDILAISDPVPPKGDVSAFQQSILYRAIDGRYRNCKATWVTMNVANFKEASERMGGAAMDRLTQDGMGLFCNWKSYRQRNVR